MKILLIGSFRHPMYAPAFEGGFRKLGYEVRVIRYEDYQYGQGLIGNLLSRLQSRLHVGYRLLAYNRRVVQETTIFQPDFVFLYRCYNIWPRTVRQLKKLGSFVFTYNNDDPFSGTPNMGYYRYFKKILPIADVNLAYRNKNVIDYESVGGNHVHLLLPYYIEENNYFIEGNDDIPIAFLGHFENDGRDKYIKALKDAEIPVMVFNGSDWELAPLYEEIKPSIKEGKRGIEYNNTLNRCQIALVFLSKLNHDTYTRRCFEIPATKTLMLCEYTEDMDRMFPADECAVYFKTADELVEKSKLLLEHPGEIKRIAQNGYDRLKELGGSEVDRCKEIIDYYRKFKFIETKE